MARIESIALGGYYPTPSDLLAAMARLLRAHSPQTFMDPCAGDGAALAQLAAAVAPRLTRAQRAIVESAQRGAFQPANPDAPPPTPEEALAVARRWGIDDCAFACVELEAGRCARVQQTIVDAGAAYSNVTVAEGDAFGVRFGLSRYAHRAGLGVDDAAARVGRAPVATVLYLNPPYDLDPVHGRLEQRFLRRFTGALVDGGVLLFVVPHYALAASAETLAREYTDVRCYRFPARHFRAFRQVVLYARKCPTRPVPDADIAAQVRAWAVRDDAPEGPGADSTDAGTMADADCRPTGGARGLPVLPGSEGRDDALDAPDGPAGGDGAGTSTEPYDLPVCAWTVDYGSGPGRWSLDAPELVMQPFDAAYAREAFDPWRARGAGARDAFTAVMGGGVPIPGIMPDSMADVLQRDFPVVMAPKPAHIAAGIAAGVFNGEPIAPDASPESGPTLLVKGAFKREFVVVSEKEDKHGTKVGEECIQQPALVVTACDLGTGAYHTLVSEPTPALPAGVPITSADLGRMTVGDLLTRYGRGLLAALNARCPVLYDPRVEGAEWAMPPTKRPPFPAQAHAIRGMVKALRLAPQHLRVDADGNPLPAPRLRANRAAVALLGEVGVGKSLCALLTARAVGARRVLVVCPPHLLDGWREQVALTLLNADVRVLRTPADVDAWAAYDPTTDTSSGSTPGEDAASADPHRMTVGLLTRETAKLGHGYVGVGRCPDCGFNARGAAATEALVQAHADAEHEAREHGHAAAAARINAALAATAQRPTESQDGEVDAEGADAAADARDAADTALDAARAKAAARIARTVALRDDEDAEARNARLRVRCPAPLPRRPANRCADALAAFAASFGRWHAPYRAYTGSTFLPVAWGRLDAQHAAKVWAALADEAEAAKARGQRPPAYAALDKSLRAAALRRITDAPTSSVHDTPANVLLRAAEAIALHIAEVGGYDSAKPLAVLWGALALLPDDGRVELATRLHGRLLDDAGAVCRWGRTLNAHNAAWKVAHVVAWSALLCDSREAAEEVAWTWPGMPATRAWSDKPQHTADHDPRIAIDLRTREAVALPHWLGRVTLDKAPDAPEGSAQPVLTGDVTVGPAPYLPATHGGAPARVPPSMRVQHLKLRVVGKRENARYDAGSETAHVSSSTLWRGIPPYLQEHAEWCEAPVGAATDARMYATDPTAPHRDVRLVADGGRVLTAEEAGDDAEEGAADSYGNARTRRRANAANTPRKARKGRCNAPLFQAVPRPRRYALAKYILRRHPKCFDFVVIDEAHEAQNSTSAQSAAMMKLAALGPPCILATGSVMNGYAESLFALWQLFPAFRAEFPRDAASLFIDRYGYRRVHVRDVEKGSGASRVVEFGSVSDRVVREVKEAGNAPGVLPLFILKYLLPHAVPLHKSDLDVGVPPCVHRVAVVEPHAEAKQAHETMWHAITAEVSRTRYTPGLAGKLFGQIAEAPSHLDRCTADVGNTTEGRFRIAYPEHTPGNPGEVWSHPGIDPRIVTAKEAWLLRTLRREFAEGRRAMVLVWHVELMARIQRVVAHHLADVLGPDKHGAPELHPTFAWGDPATLRVGVDLGGTGDGPIPEAYSTGGTAAGSTTTGGKPRKGPTLSGPAVGKGARGTTRSVFPTSLPPAEMDRLCPTLYASKVAAADRIAWLNERVVTPNARVLVVQPASVKTGVNNLVHFATQVWMENPGCDPTTYRQTVGRIDRIGQRASETRVYLGVYDTKSQHAAHKLLLAKAAVAMAADGLDAESALNAAGVGESQAALTAVSVGRQLYEMLRE